MSNENTSLVTFMDGAHPLKENATVVSLLHPHTNELQHFIVSETNIYEINSMARPYGSFFLGSRVISNGALHIVTRMDPLYFVLHTLSTTTDTQQQQQWQPLNQLDIDSVVQEALSHDLEQYKHVCAVTKLGDDLMLYKFSPKKAMKWLVQKQEAVLHIVQQQLLHAKQESKESTQQLISQGGGAFSNTFHMVPDDDNNKNVDIDVNDNNNNNKDNSESLLTSMEMQAAKEASVQIVCEYLSLEWQTKLLSHLQMTNLVDNKDDSNNTTTTLKRSRECWETTTTPGQDDADNLLQFTMGITANSSNAKEEASLAAKNKAQQAKTVGLKRLAKVNTKGMKSLSSFFGAPKQKKKTTSKNAAPAVKE